MISTSCVGVDVSAYPGILPVPSWRTAMSAPAVVRGLDFAPSTRLRTAVPPIDTSAPE